MRNEDQVRSTIFAVRAELSKMVDTHTHDSDGTTSLWWRQRCEALVALIDLAILKGL